MAAILGDPPAFEQMVNIVRPVFPDLSEFESDFRSILKSGQVTNNSRFVREFEGLLAQYLGVKFCLTFCNGETALICMLKAAKSDGGVVVPSYTFSGTVHALAWNNLTPVFADIDPESLTIDPLSVENQIGATTSAILAAPLYGNPCDNATLQSIADEHGLNLLFDSASGFGSIYQGTKLGSFGRAEIFSFHATKVFSTMEGGLLSTNDVELYESARQLRTFGQIGPVDCAVAGLNGKMMEIAALVGIHSLSNLDDTITHRGYIASRYEAGLREVPGLRFQTIASGNVSTHLYFPVVINPDEFGLNRDQLVKALEFENITIRRFLDPPVHRMTLYKDSANSCCLQVTDYIASHTAAFPVLSDMTDEEVDRICAAVIDLRRHTKEVRFALQNFPVAPIHGQSH